MDFKINCEERVFDILTDKYENHSTGKIFIFHVILIHRDDNQNILFQDEVTVDEFVFTDEDKDVENNKNTPSFPGE